MNKEAAAVAAAHSVDLSAFGMELSAAMEAIGGRFARREPRDHAKSLVLGLVAGLERKNCWTLAEHAGHASPHGLQHLLGRAVWDADGARDDMRAYVTGRLADPEAVLVVDETGDLKKGVRTVGVQRQYTGTAGRIENAQIAVFLTYAAKRGHALVDRRLYLPRSWTSDADRLAAAGVPAGVEFATKPALAAEMIREAVAADVPARWAAGDEVYGADPHLRQVLRQAGLGYVLAIGANRRVPTHAGDRRVDELTDLVPGHVWNVLPAGRGTKGIRHYSWATIDIVAEPDGPDQGSGHHAVLIRRNDTTGEIAWYRCWSPRPATTRTLALIAGQRWKVEENFQAAKGLTGLDQHQARRWDSWHRWTTLAMLAHAFLTILTTITRAADQATDLIVWTVAETRRLFNAAVQTSATHLDDILTWSRWRRTHQHRAQQAHYQRRHHINTGQPNDLRL